MNETFLNLSITILTLFLIYLLCKEVYKYGYSRGQKDLSLTILKIIKKSEINPNFIDGSDK